MLANLEDTGPPPAEKDKIDTLPTVEATEEQLKTCELESCMCGEKAYEYGMRQTPLVVETNRICTVSVRGRTVHSNSPETSIVQSFGGTTTD